MKEDEIELLFFDGNGRLLMKKVLTINGSSNKFEFKWDGRDEMGSNLPNGIYFINIHSSKINKSIKVIKK